MTKNKEQVDEHNSNTDQAEITGEHVVDQKDHAGELIEKLDEAQKESDKFKNEYLRAVADLENYRRRVIKEKEDLRKMAAATVIEGLLPVIDNLILGIDAANKNEGGSNMVAGFQMVLDQVKVLLEENGVSIIEPKVGGVFDPNEHDCVSHVPHGEVNEGDVVETIRIGYKLNGRLLRPATVVVSSGVVGDK